MLKVKVPQELFRIISYFREDEFNRFLHEKLEEYKKNLEWNDTEALLKTKEDIEKKLARMKEEIKELQDFCEMAERDQELMIHLIDKLDDENKVLLKEMNGDGDNNKF